MNSVRDLSPFHISKDLAERLRHHHRLYLSQPQNTPVGYREFIGMVLAAAVQTMDKNEEVATLPVLYEKTEMAPQTPGGGPAPEGPSAHPAVQGELFE